MNNSNEINENVKKYKIIFLIIASNDDIYYDMIQTWKKYMHKFSNIKFYFLHSRNDMDEVLFVDDDENTIFYNSDETYIPGIFLKTIYSMNYCHNNFNYDYLIRTNISTFFDFITLLKYLDNQPRNNFVGGTYGFYYDIKYINGTCIIISNNIVDKILKDIFKEDELEKKTISHIYHLPDDIIIAYLINLHVDSKTWTTVPRIEIAERLTNEKMELIKKQFFCFRNRNDNNRNLDSENIKFLGNYFL